MRLIPPILSLLAASTLGSCVTTDSGSPSPVTSTYDHGRTIYRTKCAKCHAPEPVRRYSASEWADIMPEMIDETNLGAADAAAVWEYVRVELGR